MSKINHVAIIMDGNGRWAQARGRPRVWGHIKGASVVNDIVTKASELKLTALTIYGFSTENWSRPLSEINSLFKILKRFLVKERIRLAENKVQFKVIGNISHLDQETISLIKTIEKETMHNEGLKLSLAFSYGGRQEIVDAANMHFQNNPSQKLTLHDLEKNLYRPDVGDVDLLIRSAGDQRVSNFLLWQISYAELYFSQTYWPDFTAIEFETILKHVRKRERRFGGLLNRSKNFEAQAVKESSFGT